MSGDARRTPEDKGKSPAGEDGDGEPAAAVSDLLAQLTLDTSASGAAVSAGTGHPAIFRQGTVVEIPEGLPSSPRAGREHRGRAVARPQRLVAICIKDGAQAEFLTYWALQNELVLGRDHVVLINVRVAATGMLGDLINTNNDKDDAERARSHALLRQHAAPLKHEGFAIKGVSIKGADVRGELVCKLIELKCDLAIIGGSSKPKSIRDRLGGSKALRIMENSPCPVLFVGSAYGSK
ncbi:hypothetical protein LPJ61_005091 [Coemansia biformis]|uniref:UspA domain-containing protein n=1 Tax=Coemansia biformis TaxID=1286918 RepID=A0A9W8CU34_9FUNG|nr:hypothetical protein LPJ61_005091 [Coemansia biformis]